MEKLSLGEVQLLAWAMWLYTSELGQTRETSCRLPTEEVASGLWFQHTDVQFGSGRFWKGISSSLSVFPRPGPVLTQC